MRQDSRGSRAPGRAHPPDQGHVPVRPPRASGKIATPLCHCSHPSYTRVLQLGAPEDTEVNRFAVHGFFTTLTNVNFDASRFSKEFIPKALALRAKAKVRVWHLLCTHPTSPTHIAHRHHTRLPARRPARARRTWTAPLPRGHPRRATTSPMPSQSVCSRAAASRVSRSTASRS